MLPPRQETSDIYDWSKNQQNQREKTQDAFKIPGEENQAVPDSAMVNLSWVPPERQKFASQIRKAGLNLYLDGGV